MELLVLPLLGILLLGVMLGIMLVLMELLLQIIPFLLMMGILQVRLVLLIVGAYGTHS